MARMGVRAILISRKMSLCDAMAVRESAKAHSSKQSLTFTDRIGKIRNGLLCHTRGE